MIDTKNNQNLQPLVDRIDKLVETMEKNCNQSPLVDPILDIADACQILKISKRTLQNLRSAGILSFIKVMGKVYFRKSDIEAMLEKNYVKSFKNKSNG